MPDLTAASIATLEAKGLAVSVAERTKTSLKCALPMVDKRERFALDCSIGAQHWLDRGGVMQPIQTDWAVGSDGWSDKNETSAARILVDDKGTRRIYPDQHGDAYIEFAAPEYYDGDKWQPLEVPEVASAKQVSAETAQWSSDHWRVEVVNTGSQSKLSYVMLDGKAPSRVRWAYTCCACTLDETGNLMGEKGDVIATVCRGRADYLTGSRDPTDEPIAVRTTWGKETVEYQVDTSRGGWPLVLDPTVDYQVAANANDARRYEGALGFDATGTEATVGYLTTANFLTCHQCMLFTGVSGLGSTTIDTSYISLLSKNSGAGTPLTGIYTVQAATPVMPTSAAEFDALTLGAKVDWDANSSGTAWVNSVSTNAALQELVNTYNPTAILIVHRDDGSAHGSNNYQYWLQRESYYLGTNAAKLHVEYTAAAGGSSQSLGPHRAYYARRRAA